MPVKYLSTKLAGEPDRVEDLRAAIGLVGRDAHLGHDLEDALADRLQIILLHLVGAERQPVLDPDLLDRRKGEIGVDRFGAIAGERAEMMHLAGLAGLDDDPGQGALAAPDQVMVHRRGRQQRRDRHPLGRGRAVGQDQDVVTGLDRLGGLAAQPLEGRRHAVGALRRRPGGVERIGAECRNQCLDRVDLLQIAVGQDRLRHFEPMMRAGFVAQQVRPRPDHRDQRHHQFLADRVDRRVGDLREILLEVIVEQLGLGRQRGDRRVGAHRADRVVGIARHRLQEELDVFLGVAERLLLIEMRRRDRWAAPTPRRPFRHAPPTIPAARRA